MLEGHHLQANDSSALCIEGISEISLSPSVGKFHLQPKELSSVLVAVLLFSQFPGEATACQTLINTFNWSVVNSVWVKSLGLKAVFSSLKNNAC